jgi:hypothetical protein
MLNDDIQRRIQPPAQQQQSEHLAAHRLTLFNQPAAWRRTRTSEEIDTLLAEYARSQAWRRNRQ